MGLKIKPSNGVFYCRCKGFAISFQPEVYLNDLFKVIIMVKGEWGMLN